MLRVQVLLGAFFYVYQAAVLTGSILGILGVLAGFRPSVSYCPYFRYSQDLGRQYSNTLGTRGTKCTTVDTPSTPSIQQY